MKDWALVLGGADCVWDDLFDLETMLGEAWRGIVIGVNDVGCVWHRRLDHWCTLHPPYLRAWKEIRHTNGFPGGYVCWTSSVVSSHKGVDHTVQGWGSGSSGWLALGVAKGVGCSKVVLCGVPLEVRPHFAESVEHQPDEPWIMARSHYTEWRKRRNEVQGWVRSMSGMTKKLLGAPDLAWLRSENKEQVA